MLHKTGGIVFRITPYGETSTVVNIFTQSFGLQSYMVNGLRGKSSRNKVAVYQPLNLLDMVVYHREKAGLLHIKEAHCSHVYSTLSMNIKKLSIALFLNEVLNKVVKERSHVDELYDFIRVSLVTLDALKVNIENFHLIFLIKLTRFLGIDINHAHEPYNHKMLSENENIIMQSLLAADYTTTIRLTNEERRNVLKSLLLFYSSYIHSIHSLKSTSILHEILQ